MCGRRGRLVGRPPAAAARPRASAAAAARPSWRARRGRAGHSWRPHPSVLQTPAAAADTPAAVAAAPPFVSLAAGRRRQSVMGPAGRAL
jgi:hypothetical protein